MTHKNKPSNVVPLPPDWKSAFQDHAMKTSFALALAQPMLEFLCATADDVHWDRRLYCRQWGISKPDNWIAAENALVKRGLIERKPQSVITAATYTHAPGEAVFHSHCSLTPAGVALVELLKVAGIFIEADAAIEKKAKSK